MKLIVGLGNPGIEYQFTPHNLGFLTIDRLADQCGVEVRNRQCQALTARAAIGSEPVVLAKPETYMNLSGTSVRGLVEQHQIKPEQLKDALEPLNCIQCLFDRTRHRDEHLIDRRNAVVDADDHAGEIDFGKNGDGNRCREVDADCDQRRGSPVAVMTPPVAPWYER